MVSHHWCFPLVPSEILPRTGRVGWTQLSTTRPPVSSRITPRGGVSGKNTPPG